MVIVPKVIGTWTVVETGRNAMGVYRVCERDFVGETATSEWKCTDVVPGKSDPRSLGGLADRLIEAETKLYSQQLVADADAGQTTPLPTSNIVCTDGLIP